MRLLLGRKLDITFLRRTSWPLLRPLWMSASKPIAPGKTQRRRLGHRPPLASMKPKQPRTTSKTKRPKLPRPTPTLAAVERGLLSLLLAVVDGERGGEGGDGGLAISPGNPCGGQCVRDCCGGGRRRGGSGSDGGGLGGAGG
uniref:Uncharacterized protein n=1 Tax=Calcidiscus leptoporus TaxID=127549 RepID=A0A7S0P0E6_9EUKA